MIYRRTYYGAETHEVLQPQYPKPYGCMSFLFDCLMIALTGGFWFIWIFCREMRKRNGR